MGFDPPTTGPAVNNLNPECMEERLGLAVGIFGPIERSDLTTDSLREVFQWSLKVWKVAQRRLEKRNGRGHRLNVDTSYGSAKTGGLQEHGAPAHKWI